VVEPDTVVTGLTNTIGWYHRNVKSIGPDLTAEIQDLAGLMSDPLLHRTFGVVIATPGGQRLDDRRLVSPTAREHRFTLAVHTAQPVTADAWLAQTQNILAQAEAISPAQRRTEHEAWWREFWSRSWIHVTTRAGSQPAITIPANDYALRVGFDQHGQNRFLGEFARVSVWTRGLGEAEIAALAAGSHDLLPASAGAVGSWAATPGTELALGDADLTRAMTLEAWIRPEAMPTSGGRILDKVTPGGADGFLFDTYPGNSLRFIVGREIHLKKDILTPGEWHHVAAVVDPEQGRIRVYHNGKPVAESTFETGNDTFVISRAYALQRFVTACAGRGHYPIKFNGSIFTVPHAGTPGDADYRRWGPGYWWQNTRLPYLALCTSGDTEMMQPLFRMYAQDLLPLFIGRTQRYFGHDGAYIPECIYFWGAVFSESYGWQPARERADKLQTSGWHKWEWVSGPELAWMLFDYYDHTDDEAFARNTLLPFARAVIAFFDQHYQTVDGKLFMHPSQSLETWWDCDDPMPEVAGLHAMVERLLALPEGLASAADRTAWETFRAKLPPLPTRTENGVEMLAAAARFADKRNCENPELYAVFPFRQIAIGRPGLELGTAALAHRQDRGHFGWRQDDIFMAYLGLAEEARKGLVARARKRDPDSRFPAFWGPNYDWVPDQDHGGVLMKTLQSMVLQAEPVPAGDRLFVLPAWPTEWNVDFRLHAPHGTIVEGTYADGQFIRLQVTPESRRADLRLPGSEDRRE
jgi:hypothetical protein